MISPVLVTRPMAWGYCRVSDGKQWDKGNSVPEQKARIEEYYRRVLAPDGVDWGGVESDEKAVSATKTMFAHRPAGARLISILRANDHLLVDNLDRIWRNALDFEHLVRWLERQNVHLHILSMRFQDGPVDTRSAGGMLTLRILMGMAAAETKRISERTIAHNVASRKIGRASGRFNPLGTKTVKRWNRGEKRYVGYLEWDAKQRAVMGEIVRLVTEEHMSFAKISEKLERDLAAASGRFFSTSAFYKRFWTLDRVKDGYYLEQFYRGMNITDVTQIPTDTRRASRVYCRRVGIIASQPRQIDPYAL